MCNCLEIAYAFQDLAWSSVGLKPPQELLGYNGKPAPIQKKKKNERERSLHGLVADLISKEFYEACFERLLGE